jgi:hypothetical protein
VTRAPWLPQPDNPDDLTLFDRESVPPIVTPEPGEDTIEGRFREFHAANPWVYERLRYLARDLVDKGHTRIGIGMLFEVLRWQYARATINTDGLKLNNDFRSRYARLLADNEPDLADAFETRRLRTA